MKEEGNIILEEKEGNKIVEEEGNEIVEEEKEGNKIVERAEEEEGKMKFWRRK